LRCFYFCFCFAIGWLGSVGLIMIFQEKIEKTTESFETLSEKLAYIQGLKDGLQEGNDIVFGRKEAEQKEESVIQKS
jgi:hypothetical protein